MAAVTSVAFLIVFVAVAISVGAGCILSVYYGFKLIRHVKPGVSPLRSGVIGPFDLVFKESLLTSQGQSLRRRQLFWIKLAIAGLAGGFAIVLLES